MKKLRVGHWRAVQIALYVGASEFPNAIQLVASFDAFSSRRHAQTLRQTGYRLNDGGRFGAATETADEASVDLDLVEREAAKITQRRITSAEIIHRNADTERTQLMKSFQSSFGVLHQHRLGDFQLQPMRGQLRCGQRAQHRRQEILAGQLCWREIDGDANFIRPRRCILAGSPDDPFAEGDDQSDLLGEWDEFVRRDDAALRMMPADQCLTAAHVVGGQVHDRLIVHFEFAVLECHAKRKLQRSPSLHAGIHPRLEETIDSAAIRLGAVQGHVGVLEQLVGVGAVSGCKRDADAGVDHHQMAMQVVGSADRLGKAPRQPFRVSRVGDIGLDDREFITAYPGDSVGVPHAGVQPCSHRPQ